MGHMDEALSSYKPASGDDLAFDFPAIRRPEPVAAAQVPEAGEHGGTASGTAGVTNAEAAAVATGATSQASAAPEPAPQRDETDDGEHTRSVEEVVVVPAVVEVDESEEDPVAEQANESDDADGDELSEKKAPATPLAPEDVSRALADIAGREPKTFQKTGFTAGDAETLTVKRFPVPLVDGLRLSLAPATGGEFAQALSAPAIITAFLIAKMGLELEVDANTAVAVDVFRQSDPRLLSVENKLDEVLSEVGQLAAAMKSNHKRASETAKVVDGLEFASAYLIADRVAGLTTADVDETNVDVSQKKVLTARETIRRGAKKQRDIEREREGRRMA